MVKVATGPMRVSSKATPKAKGTSGTSKARPPAARSKSPPNASKSVARSKRAARDDNPASEPTTPRKRNPADWRDETLARMRALILEADPEVIEERKWRKPSNGMVGVPVWSHDGIVCTGERYTKVVKLTFAQGASIPDPKRLFNSSLEGNMRRAIDIRQGEEVDAGHFKALVKAAVARNSLAKKR